MNDLRSMIWTLLAAAIVVAGLPQAVQAQSSDREQIRIVGSSTVYPFASAVAEEFGETTRFATPVIESTGSGGGMKLFGEGAGLDTPDITNASRKVKLSEFTRAKKNGVNKITEAVIGYDGIAIAQNKANSSVNFSRKQIALAVAAKVPNPDGSGLVDNPYESWSDISSDLPDREIKFYGPPTTSGTRDAFEEMVVGHATSHMSAYDGAFTQIRQDEHWVNSGENDNLIVRKLDNNRAAFGIFGYSFLDNNRDVIEAASVNGAQPNPSKISTGEYPISRSLYFYVKASHLDDVPGMYQYIKMFMSEDMIGPDGQLAKLGLIPLPEKLRKASRERVMSLEPLKIEDGKLQTLHDYAKQNGFAMTE
jgi:phosphate transport system substrate-binding protein